MLKIRKPSKFDPPIFCEETNCKGKRKLLFNVTPKLAMGMRKFHYQCENCGRKVIYTVQLESEENHNPSEEKNDGADFQSV